jgi:hypothetical protein
MVGRVFLLTYYPSGVIPTRRTGQLYADLERKKPQIRKLSQKDLLNLREKKNFFASLRLCEKKKISPQILWKNSADLLG